MLTWLVWKTSWLIWEFSQGYLLPGFAEGRVGEGAVVVWGLIKHQLLRLNSFEMVLFLLDN